MLNHAGSHTNVGGAVKTVAFDFEYTSYRDCTGEHYVLIVVLAFRPLSKFGNAFLNRFQCSGQEL